LSNLLVRKRPVNVTDHQYIMEHVSNISKDDRHDFLLHRRWVFLGNGNVGQSIYANLDLIDAVETFTLHQALYITVWTILGLKHLVTPPHGFEWWGVVKQQ